MAVRVRLRVKGRKAEVVVAALVNTGFESSDPELILPLEVADLLGLEPETASPMSPVDRAST